MFVTADDDLGVEAIAVRTGIFWHWSQQVELSDLAIEATALEL